MIVHRLFESDAFTMLARLFPPEAELTVLDVGAHDGGIARRILAQFPAARVYAFEPSPAPGAALRALAAEDQRVHAVLAAAGDAPGEADLHVTANAYCSSLLPPSELGRRFYGGWYETAETVRVPVITIDDWADGAGVERADIVKIDVQGAELRVLRGMQRLLERGVQAVKCEAQLIAEYDGAATFTDIDLFLRQRGFVLHQIGEIATSGEELQSSYLDALWLREDALRRIRERPLFRALPSRLHATEAALARIAADGRRRVVLYGAGQHTRHVLPRLENPPAEIVAVLDDAPPGGSHAIAGRPIVSRGELARFDPDAVLLSSDAHEQALWNRSADLRDAGLPVYRIYGFARRDNAAPEPVIAAAAAGAEAAA